MAISPRAGGAPHDAGLSPQGTALGKSPSKQPEATKSPSKQASAGKSPSKQQDSGCRLTSEKSKQGERGAQSSSDWTAPSLDALPRFRRGGNVSIAGIESRPELNGQVGQILSFDGGVDKRYTVRISGTVVSLRECKLTKVSKRATAKQSSSTRPPKAPRRASNEGAGAIARPAAAGGAKTRTVGGGSNARSSVGGEHVRAVGSGDAARAVAQADVSAQDFTFDTLPMGQLTAQGQLVPTYSWVKVPAVAALPPGLEVRIHLTGGKCARIPSTWRLQVVAEGQCDAYRCDVGQHTPIADVIRGAASAFTWDTRAIQLRVDGAPASFETGATVGSAALFGRKLTARKQPAS